MDPQAVTKLSLRGAGTGLTVTGNREVSGAGQLTQGVMGPSQPDRRCGCGEDSGRCAV